MSERNVGTYPAFCLSSDCEIMLAIFPTQSIYATTKGDNEEIREIEKRKDVGSHQVPANPGTLSGSLSNSYGGGAWTGILPPSILLSRVSMTSGII